MAAPCENVVLCRGASERSDSEDNYIEVFTGKGYTCQILTTLRFEFVNIEVLGECLLSPHLYDGLILTSKRAAEAVLLACKGNRGILQKWNGLPTYCVGPASESFIKTHLGLDNCCGSESGNAEDLSKFIVRHFGTDRPKNALLYPCNEIARETIQKKLEDCDIAVKKVISYKPFPSETLEQDLFKIIDSVPSILVFFSPSMVEHILNVFKKRSTAKNVIKAVAIGPVTKQALIDAGFEVYATAEKPEPKSLVEAILNAKKA